MAKQIQNNKTDDEKLQDIQKKFKLAKLIMIVSGVFFAIAVLTFIRSGSTELSTGNPTGNLAIGSTIVGFLLLFFGLWFKQKTGAQQKGIAVSYARESLERAMDRLDEYNHSKEIGRYYINQDLGFPDHNHIGYCGDYVRGVFHNIPLEFCEFELQEEYTRRDNDGDVHTTTKTVFRGLMIVCKHDLELEEAVVLSQYTNFQDSYDTGNVEFDKLYSASCQNKDDAVKAITPEYMQKLMQLSSAKGKRFAVRFLKNGSLIFVIKDLNMFEANKVTNTAQLRDKMDREMADLGQIIDTLAYPAKREKA